jgi:DNA-binding CsgD family transcriptional regulator
MSSQSSMQMERRTNAMVPDLHAAVMSRKDPGIVILNGLGELVHENDAASEMLSQLRQYGPVSKNGLVPDVMMDLCQELGVKVPGKHSVSLPGRLEATHFMTTTDGGVLIRALALEGAKELSSQGKQFLIMLEHISERGQSTEAGKERYCLTDREWQVTQALAQGFTNKEIANALGIAEPTVKSHMKHIMQKMKCTTRTAIVSQLAGSLVCGSA